MNNLLPRADRKYSGAFEEAMLDTDLGNKYQRQGGIDFEEQMFLLPTGINVNDINLRSMRKLHFYQVLPYEIYSDSNKDDREVYFFNLRGIFLQAIDQDFKKLQSNSLAFLSGSTGILLIVGLCLCFTAKTKPKGNRNATSKEEGVKKAEKQEEAKEKVSSPKKESPKKKEKSKKH